MATIHWLRKSSDIKNLEWDLATITPGDFTVEFTITHKFFENYRKDVYEIPGGDKDKGISIAGSLEDFMRKHFE